jgi:hypothetical protein
MASTAPPFSTAEHSSSPERMDLARWGAMGAAAMMLLGGAVYAWPGQIDDAYISLVFSHELAETGRMAWSDGRIVEGYSNLAWVLLGALPALLQIDGGLVLQGAALLSMFATLFILFPRRGAGLSSTGLLVPLLFAAAEPTAWWAANAMETPAFGLCLALGWRALLVEQRVSIGIVLLSLSALLRPEGHIHLVLALMVSPPKLLRSNLPAVGTMIVTFAAYHLVRASYFGELLPLPAMVKGVDGPGILKGVVQAGIDLLPWVGLLGLAAAYSGVPTRARRLALLPILVQLAVLSKAGGDWMGHGRLVLPGVVAALGVWTAMHKRKAFKLSHLLLVPLAALPILTVSPTGTPTNIQARDLGGVLAALGHPRIDLDTTLMTDLQFVIPRLPRGAMVYAGDIGMLGHVPELAVRDMVGLTDADIARSRAFGDSSALARTMERLDGTSDSALCLRMVGWGASSAPDLPPAQASAYPVRYELADSWSTIRWSCREPLHSDSTLSQERWAELERRFPDHSWIRWNHALAVAENGDVEGAAMRLKAATKPWRWSPWRENDRAALLFTSSPSPLLIEDGAWFRLAGESPIMSRPLSHQELQELELEYEGASTVTDLDLTIIGPACKSTVRQRVVSGSGTLRPGKGKCGADLGPLRVEVAIASGQSGRVRQSNR